MNGADFLQALRELQSLRSQPELWSRRKQELLEELSNITLAEEQPGPEEDYPAWMKFKAQFPEGLKDSHLCGHYSELGEVALASAANLYRSLVSFVLRTPVNQANLQSWAEKQVKEGTLSHFEPACIPDWKQQKHPELTPYYLRCTLELGELVPIRAGLAKPEHVALLRRHGGEQLNFCTSLAYVVEQFESSTFLLTLWVLVDPKSPSQPKVRFGTGYIGNQFPVEDGGLLTALFHPDTSSEALMEKVDAFVAGVDANDLMFTLLPPECVGG